MDVRRRGRVVNYFVSESRAYFGDERKFWLETSVRVDASFGYKNFAAEVSILGLKTTGGDPFGTGTAAAGAPTETRAAGTFPVFHLDKANVRLSNVGSLSLKLTVGRQHIQIGSQFLVGDGVYDGYSPTARQAVYSNPRRGFDAVRAEWDYRGVRFDAFAFRVDRTWDAGGGRDGVFGGLEVSRTSDATEGTYAAGV
jgi:hypothetical protein